MATKTGRRIPRSFGGYDHRQLAQVILPAVFVIVLGALVVLATGPEDPGSSLAYRASAEQDAADDTSVTDKTDLNSEAGLSTGTAQQAGTGTEPDNANTDGNPEADVDGSTNQSTATASGRAGLPVDGIDGGGDNPTRGFGDSYTGSADTDAAQSAATDGHLSAVLSFGSSSGLATSAQSDQVTQNLGSQDLINPNTVATTSSSTTTSTSAPNSTTSTTGTEATASTTESTTSSSTTSTSMTSTSTTSTSTKRSSKNNKSTKPNKSVDSDKAANPDKSTRTANPKKAANPNRPTDRGRKPRPATTAGTDTTVGSTNDITPDTTAPGNGPSAASATTTTTIDLAQAAASSTTTTIAGVSSTTVRPVVTTMSTITTTTLLERIATPTTRSSTSSSTSSSSTTTSSTTTSAPTTTTTTSPTVGQPRSYADNLAMIRASSVRNTNHDSSAYRNVRQSQLTINNHLGPRSEYLNNPGGNSEQAFPTADGGNFRVSCEFSHFSYDDPLVHPNKPGAAHLHMFWGNTDVNAYSTYETLINSGGGTCNGQELNRSGYWAPAMFDSSGNVRIPMRIDVYYKGYNMARDNAEIYPPGAAKIAKNVNEIATADGGVAGIADQVSFSCTDSYRSHPRTPSGNRIPTCGDTNSYGNSTVLEHNVKFQNCLYGNDPSDPDSWGLAAAGNWFWADCGSGKTFPHLEYIIQYRLESGESTAGWYLSSDVNHQTSQVQSAGASSHADWWGGWEPEVNRMWLENCTTYKTSTASGCGQGYLTDGGPDGQNPYAGPALKMRPQYTGPNKVRASALFNELCNSNHSIGQASEAAFCSPSHN